jgi:prepilin-type N-terminal cleavage/methylation domain-containing protein
MSCAARRRGPRDAGFTLIELMVGMVVLGIFATTAMTVALSMQNASATAGRNSNLVHETSLAMERLVRELRQAGTIDAVQLPAAAGAAASITFWADFNNNGVRELDASDPEVLTYRFTPGAGNLTLTVNDAAGNAITTPILATDVTALGLAMRSSLWQYDRNGDGVTDWSELDATPGVGNQNGIPDAPELALVDVVVVSISVRDGSQNQTYRTQVDFRNRHLS